MVFGCANTTPNNWRCARYRKERATDGWSETRGQDEHLELNEDTLWSGRRMNMLNPNAGEAVPKIRKLLFDSGGTNA